MASEAKDVSLMGGDTSMEKKRRKRQKRLILEVCQQIEFYFSDANLRKDRFLKKEMEKNKDGYISVDVIASFNKLLMMKADKKMVISAIQQSTLLELSKDEILVRRKEALKPPRYDPDDCTVYVECLPKKTDHDWLKKAFSYCGKVVYVSLPRYKSTSDIKGFAFIEFECPDDAERACEVMNNPPPDMMYRAGKFPMMKGNRRIVPLEFDLSKQQYPRRVPDGHSEYDRVDHGKGADVKQSRGNGAEVDGDRLKRKRGIDDGDDDLQGHAKERKSEKDSSEQSDKQKGLKRKHDEDHTSEEAVRKSMRKHTSSSESCDKEDDDREERKRKLLQQAKMHMMKRKRSLSEGDMWRVRENDDDSDSEHEVKKSRRDETGDGKMEGSKGEESPEKKKRNRKKKMKRIQEEEEALFLRVIPKREWLFLKEEYLALQKESLAQMKEAKRGRYRMPERQNQIQAKIPEVDTSKSEISDGTVPESKHTDIAFTAGTVMKLECLQPSVLRKEVKENLQSLSPVAYVDLPDGHTQGFVRFETAEGPKTVLEETNIANLASQHISLSLVSGAEEKAYWEKLARDREIKLNSQQQKKKKKRGVNKNARKTSATKEKTHIHFDE